MLKEENLLKKILDTEISTFMISMMINNHTK